MENQVAIVIEAEREAYGMAEIAGRTMTIRELIDRLEEEARFYGDDAKVIISNDRGYTYGAVMNRRITVEDVEEDN